MEFILCMAGKGNEQLLRNKEFVEGNKKRKAHAYTDTTANVTFEIVTDILWGSVRCI